MHDQPVSSLSLLPHAVPASPYARLLLYGVRRMAAGGIDDAFAAHAFFAGFAIGYRRPLVLLRAAMAEMSRVAGVKVVVAPCCCPRMTGHESALLRAAAGALAEPDRAHALLTGMLKVRECLGLLTSLQAVNAAFADCGMPLEDDCA